MKVLADDPKLLNELMKETGLSRASLFKHPAHLKGAVSYNKHISTFEKGGWCKETKINCSLHCPFTKKK